MGGLSSLLGTMRYVTHKFMIQNFILQPSWKKKIFCTDSANQRFFLHKKHLKLPLSISAVG
jgi:hypothetical protein